MNDVSSWSRLCRVPVRAENSAAYREKAEAMQAELDALAIERSKLDSDRGEFLAADVATQARMATEGPKLLGREIGILQAEIASREKLPALFREFSEEIRAAHHEACEALPRAIEEVQAAFEKIGFRRPSTPPVTGEFNPGWHNLHPAVVAARAKITALSHVETPTKENADGIAQARARLEAVRRRFVAA